MKKYTEYRKDWIAKNGTYKNWLKDFGRDWNEYKLNNGNEHDILSSSGDSKSNDSSEVKPSKAKPKDIDSGNKKSKTKSSDKKSVDNKPADKTKSDVGELSSDSSEGITESSKIGGFTPVDDEIIINTLDEKVYEKPKEEPSFPVEQSVPEQEETKQTESTDSNKISLAGEDSLEMMAEIANSTTTWGLNQFVMQKHKIDKNDIISTNWGRSVAKVVQHYFPELNLSHPIWGVVISGSALIYAVGEAKKIDDKLIEAELEKEKNGK